MAINPIYEKAKERAQKRSLEPATLSNNGVGAFLKGIAAGMRCESRDVGWKLGGGVVETTEGFSAVCGLLLALEAKKGKKYAGSWIKRGELGGVWSNVQRKVDRLEECVGLGMDTEDTGGPEGRIECIADMCVYGIKWLTYLMETEPAEFQKFIERIRSL